MNNRKIIKQEAVASGFFSEDEVKDLIEQNRDIPFHTYSVWRSRYGLVPKKGEHGWQTKLWKHKQKKVLEEEDSGKKEFYLAKSFLFHISQCAKEDEDEK